MVAQSFAIFFFWQSGVLTKKSKRFPLDYRKGSTAWLRGQLSSNAVAAWLLLRHPQPTNGRALDCVGTSWPHLYILFRRERYRARRRGSVTSPSWAKGRPQSTFYYCARSDIYLYYWSSRPTSLFVLRYLQMRELKKTILRQRAPTTRYVMWGYFLWLWLVIVPRILQSRCGSNLFEVPWVTAHHFVWHADKMKRSQSPQW
jgi:hypothetical protein